ncbi:hypothetical protein JTE90_014958 [Oedothorax gibbosus]|uniref:Uncharacterized protein n=1 Tax=Oedothorax gibbosus TaxID=931172 RepID=A0AAV6UYT2_9ARAC|nr:hypothetical protein JTE90_014958 [Oedothorax gibbosus]
MTSEASLACLATLEAAVSSSSLVLAAALPTASFILPPVSDSFSLALAKFSPSPSAKPLALSWPVSEATLAKDIPPSSAPFNLSPVSPNLCVGERVAEALGPLRGPLLPRFPEEGEAVPQSFGPVLSGLSDVAEGLAQSSGPFLDRVLSRFGDVFGGDQPALGDSFDAVRQPFQPVAGVRSAADRQEHQQKKRQHRISCWFN